MAVSLQTFAQRHGRKLLLAAALLLIAIVAVAVAVPLILRSTGSEEDNNATDRSMSSSSAERGGVKDEMVKTTGDKIDEEVEVKDDDEEDDDADIEPTNKDSEADDGAEAVHAKDVDVKEAEVTVAKAAPPKATATYGGSNCVYTGGDGVIVMDAKVPKQGSENDWALRDKGVEFRPWSGDPHRVYSVEESAPRDYRFTVGQAGRYIVSAVSTGGGRTDFNDMWLHFGYGGGLEFGHFRSGQVGGSGTGYYKAYHNDGKDKVGIFTVDHSPHVFSTKDQLEPGTVYTLRVVGRASRFTLQRLLLQRCDEGTCVGTRESRQQLKDAALGGFAPCVDLKGNER